MAAAGYDDIVLLDTSDSISQWRLGDVLVTKVVETEMQRSAAASLPNTDEDRLQSLPWLNDGSAFHDGQIRFSFHTLVIECPTRTIVVDTCFGNDKSRPGMSYCDNLKLPFLERLALAGFRRESIDTVICTHFHPDHIGWNTMLVDGQWQPTFPRARYLFAGKELAHWSKQFGDSRAAPRTDSMAAAYFDSIRPIVNGGLVDLVGTRHRLCDQVVLLPTPGHTPGHVSVLIESRGEFALVTGDAIHHPCQLADLRWSSGFDFDAAQAARTRRAILETAVETHALVIGTHWAGASASYVARDGDAYRLVR
jgi:glyoxylase-like metal-dependent hydrolase (beta-lactamase superfamily II)